MFVIVFAHIISQYSIFRAIPFFKDGFASAEQIKGLQLFGVIYLFGSDRCQIFLFGKAQTGIEQCSVIQTVVSAVLAPCERRVFSVPGPAGSP